MLEGAAVRLAPLRPEDSALMFEWINDRELVTLSAPFEPVDERSHRNWFEQIQGRPDVEIFGIRLKEDDRLIGSCQLRGIAPGEGTCELQIRIGDREAQGLGHGTEAVGLLLRHAFGDLGLDRIELQVFEGNEPAIRAYEKAGFRRRELLREAAVIEGEPIDLVVMSISATELSGDGT